MQCKRKFVLDQKYSGDLNTEADKVVCQEYENGLLSIAPMPKRNISDSGIKILIKSKLVFNNYVSIV